MDAVTKFLRGQNLEQVGRTEEAVELYEQVVAEGFDAAGPYDRLIFIYQTQRRHEDVIRIAEASLQVVKTYPEKRSWYEQQIARAIEERGSTPDPL